jgi:carbonic anhydrase
MVGDLLRNNAAWAAGKVRVDPDFFKRLVAQQSPNYLWIGCSDSRVPANELIGMAPGELFVHRNVANLVPPQDANCLSVLQYAVEVLKVKHVIVCGHYGCGGVRSAVSGERLGLIDHWLQPIRDVCDEHVHDLCAIDDPDARLDALCEHNVVAQVRNLASNPFVQDAWLRGQALSLHAWVYDIHDGIINDLGATISDITTATARFPSHSIAISHRM